MNIWGKLHICNHKVNSKLACEQIQANKRHDKTFKNSAHKIINVDIQSEFPQAYWFKKQLLMHAARQAGGTLKMNDIDYVSKHIQQWEQ